MRVRAALIAAGALLVAGVLLSALRWPEAALTGWLAGATAAACVPAGALVLALMMRLIPGAWGEVLRLACEAALLITPLAALTFVPLFFGLGAVYPWVHRAPASAFAAAWLTPGAFVVRTLLWFAVSGALGWALLRRRRTEVVAAVGLVVMPVLTHFVAIDWLLSRDTRFAASAFGLQLLSIMVTTAFCVTIILRHATGARSLRTGVLGMLLLTLLLIWAYLSFMAYLIVWSGNLPAGVGWYQERARDGWGAALWLTSLLGGVPMLALLFRPVRRSARWLAWLAGAVLAGKLIELLWLALPPLGLGAALFGVASLGGIGLLIAGLLPTALAWRIRRRTA